MHVPCQVRIWSRNSDSVIRFAEDIRVSAEAAGTTVKMCATPKEAVEGADVICTVTFATTPVIHKDWVKPGAHINGECIIFREIFHVMHSGMPCFIH